MLVGIDIEPDERTPAVDAPVALSGVPVVMRWFERLRPRLASAAGAPVRATWYVRMDPQIERCFGRHDALARRYRSELDGLAAGGDELGVHPHAWRWTETGWVVDYDDDEWMRECADVSLRTFVATFGHPCRAMRAGDRHLTPGLFAAGVAHGVRVDLTVEPGAPPITQHIAGERSSGWIRDMREAPRHAYVPDLLDPLRIAGRPGGEPDVLVELPAALNPIELAPWNEPAAFRAAIEARLDDDDLTHLGFAFRTDLGTNPGLLERVTTNLDWLARRLGPAAVWTTASGAVDQVPAPGTWRPPPDPGVLDWRAGRVPLPMPCPACGGDGDGERVVTALRPPACVAPLEAVRCDRCQSLVLEKLPPTPLSDGEWVDHYVEHLAGIEPMIEVLSAVDAPPGTRLLEIGGGYGFALDAARHLWGWVGVGFDPSPIARRGAVDLGLDLRAELLRPETDVGPPFGVALASEVLEHVADPVGFLRGLRARLTSDGVLVLTTPNAEFVRPDNDLPTLVAVLSPGDHVCLFTARSLADLLGRAGFCDVEVRADGPVLRATGLAGPGRVDRRRAPHPHPEALAADYAVARGRQCRIDSPLAVGMWSRAVRIAAARGDHELMAVARPFSRAALLARHGLDIDDAVPATGLLPGVLADLRLSLGMFDLVHAGRPGRAAEHFAAALAAAERGPQGRSPMSVRLVEQARRHRLLALARDPEPPGAVVAALDELVAADPDGADPATVATIGRAFTDLVAGGHLDVADLIAGDPGRLVARAPIDHDDARRAALDARFSQALLDWRRGRIEEARNGFDRVVADAVGVGDDHGDELAGLARRHADLVAADRPSPVTAVKGAQ
ncbi:MAG: methyltransferase domain-containing protein [Desertimonas sp.]